MSASEVPRFRLSRRSDPEQTMQVVEYHLDSLRRGLAGGRFRPVVRHAAILAELIRLAAIAEEHDALDPAPLIIPIRPDA